MELLDLIEGRRFMGREFVVWLWFESEMQETNLQPTGADPVSMWLEAQITLVLEKEESRLKGAIPASSPEAKEALRQGKLPKEAKMRLVRGEREYAWTLKADSLALSGLKLPTQLKKNDEKHEVFYERMMLLEDLETSLSALYADFVRLRLADPWDDEIVPLMKSWAYGEKADAGAYLATKRAVLGEKRKRKR
ncbi:hypothetical protein [Polyangium sorediatum]|uniref:Uncharacterized protein n=1 Tax=Polyangium sorediatum TaxID=889274 RepID=A0ABT6NLF9_9BACT|nr:hypothetical protein [Polyangium sorediatum]MDI1429150.1 hypothetical protein [Polyangium sorediatum]